MAAYSNKLCNPTPFETKVLYGVEATYTIPPFGSVDLPYKHAQAYRPDARGAEAISNTLAYSGVFLLDHDRPYEVQAAERIKVCLAERKDRYEKVISTVRDQRLAQGYTSDEGAILQAVTQMGYSKTLEQINTLADLLKEYSKVLEQNSSAMTGVAVLDPTRTVFVMDPPTEFPSKTAMNFFLALPENAELAAKHTVWVNQQNVQKRGPGRPAKGELDETATV